MQIKDKVGIVTGAASGIGRATAFELINQGVKGIALVDINEESLTTLAQEINIDAGKEVAIACAGDVTDETFRESVFDLVTERYGIAQIVVPAAGIFRDRLAVKIEVRLQEKWRVACYI